MSAALDRLKNLTAQISSYELARKNNLLRLHELYEELKISDKVDEFEDIFLFKAMNLSGVSLQDSVLAQIQKGKYIQIIAIMYDKDAVVKNKNISLGYFGRAEKAERELVLTIVEFVLGWRFEKSFKTLEHYHNMIGSLKDDSQRDTSSA